MPNTVLIEQVQQLLDSYVQQNKTSTALQAAFKGFQSAQNKTLKAFTEYSNTTEEYNQA